MRTGEMKEVRIEITEFSRINLKEPILPDDFPRVITLCGSTRFKEDFERVQADLTDKGIIVISVGRFGHRDGLDMDGDHKKMLDKLHKRKIDLSDGIFVINAKVVCCAYCRKPCETGWPENGEVSLCCGDNPVSVAYVGKSTRSEIEYAKGKNKSIEYLNPPEGE